eukprot:631661_1
MAQQPVYPQFVEEAPHISENEFKVHCAIDFGTDGVALAYSFGKANSVTAHAEWGGKKYAAKFKPKTIVLLDETYRAIGFGKDAKHTYMVTHTMKDKWMLFERFKMALYEGLLYTKGTTYAPRTYNHNSDTPGVIHCMNDEKQVEI